MKKQLLLGAIAILLASYSVTAAYINVGELDLDFCNGGNKLDIKMDAGASTGFCVRLTNLSIKTGTVQLGLVDGEMSEGAHPVQACKTDANGVFGRSAILHGESTFILKPEESIIKTGTITLKTGFVGVMQGCTVFTIIDDVAAQQSGQMFSVITRKANTISITVSGEVKTEVIFGEPSLTHNADNSYTFALGLTNKGTVSTEIVGSTRIVGGIGKRITDFLGLPPIMPFTREIPLNTITVYPGDTKQITMQIADLPRYGGSYSLAGDLTYKPIVDASITLPGGAHSFSTVWEYGVQKYGVRALLAGTIIAILVLLAIIILIIRLRRRKKRKQAGNTTHISPTPDTPAPKPARKKKENTADTISPDISEAQVPTPPVKKTYTRKKKIESPEETVAPVTVKKKRVRKDTPTDTNG